MSENSSQVSVITGGGRGLGRAYALAMAARGDRVAICDLNSESAARVRDEVETLGGVALDVEIDVAEPGSVATAAGRIREELGPVATLVNNAARFADIPLRPFSKVPLDEWDAVMDVNLKGAFICTREFAQDMIASRYGRIVNASSSTVWTGRPGYPHYVASKAGLIGLTRALAAELGEFGITVNAITPGAIRTEVDRATMPEERWNEIARATPVERYGTPNDLLEAILLLTSPESGFMTGQVLNVDGGRSFR